MRDSNSEADERKGIRTDKQSSRCKQRDLLVRTSFKTFCKSPILSIKHPPPQTPSISSFPIYSSLTLTNNSQQICRRHRHQHTTNARRKSRRTCRIRSKTLQSTIGHERIHVTSLETPRRAFLRHSRSVDPARP